MPPADKHQRVSFTVRVRAETHQQLLDLVARDYHFATLNHAVEVALREFLERRHQDQTPTP